MWYGRGGCKVVTSSGASEKIAGIAPRQASARVASMRSAMMDGAAWRLGGLGWGRTMYEPEVPVPG